MENVRVAHWSEQLKIYSENDDKQTMVDIANGLCDLVVDKDYELIDTILSTFHPKYLSSSAMILLLNITGRVKEHLQHWIGFLIKAYAEINRRSQDL